MLNWKRKPNPANVYANQMFSRGNGLGLWRPEPNGSSTTGELLIGDVGFVDDGAFTRLFNVARAASDSINSENGVPDNFTPLSYRSVLERRSAGQFPRRPMGSRSVQWDEVLSDTKESGHPRKYFRVSCNGSEGAMLLASNEVRDYVAPNETFKRYMLEHHRSWHERAQALGHPALEEDIVLVAAVTKVPEWTTAAWGHGFGGGAEAVDGGVWVGRVQLTGPSVTFRTSQAANSTPPTTKKGDPDQCVFLSYYKIKKRLWRSRTIVAMAGPHEPPLGDRDDEAADDTTIQSTPESEALDDPLDHLLEYILQTTDAEVAIASHLDLEELLGEGNWPENMTAYLKERQPPIDVDQAKVGSLSLVAAIQRGHAREVEEAKRTLRKRHPGLPFDAPIEPAEPAEKAEVLQVDQPQPAAHEMDVDMEGEPKILVTRTQIQHDTFATGSIVLKDETRLDLPHRVLHGSIDGEAGAVHSSSVSKDGTLFAAGYDDPRVRVWDIKSGTLVYQLRGHSDQVVSLAFSPQDEFKLVAGSADGKAIIWNLANPSATRELVGHGGSVCAVAFSPDGNIIATGSADSTVKLWDADTGGLLRTLEGHPDTVLRVTFSPDKNQILVGAGDTVFLWDIQDPTTAQQVTSYSDIISSVAFSPDSKNIIASSSDGTGHVLDAELGEKLSIVGDYAKEVKVIAYSPDNQRVVLGSADGTLTICDPRDGSSDIHLTERASEVVTAIYSPDGGLIASGSVNGSVRLWNAENGTFIAELQGHTPRHGVKSIAFTPGSEMLISSSEDGTSRLWKVVDVLRVSH